MSEPKAKAPADMSVDELKALLASKESDAAHEGFKVDIKEAQKSGFTAMVVPAHNGGSPALRVDY